VRWNPRPPAAHGGIQSSHPGERRTSWSTCGRTGVVMHPLSWSGQETDRRNLWTPTIHAIACLIGRNAEALSAGNSPVTAICDTCPRPARSRTPLRSCARASSGTRGAIRGGGLSSVSARRRPSPVRMGTRWGHPHPFCAAGSAARDARKSAGTRHFPTGSPRAKVALVFESQGGPSAPKTGGDRERRARRLPERASELCGGRRQ
jgi:hypothetical protein